jgi:hypothetical protein
MVFHIYFVIVYLHGVYRKLVVYVPVYFGKHSLYIKYNRFGLLAAFLLNSYAFPSSLHPYMPFWLPCHFGDIMSTKWQGCLTCIIGSRDG